MKGYKNVLTKRRLHYTIGYPLKYWMMNC